MNTASANDVKERPTSVTVRCRVTAHNTPYMDLNCSPLQSVYRYGCA